MKNISLIIGIFIFFASCDNNEPEFIIGDDAFLWENFVQVYFIPTRVTVIEYPKEGFHSADNEALTIRFWGKRADERENPDLFNYYARLYGDTLYNRPLQPASNCAIADAFSKISVVADADFDAAHPAGTPLDDIICLRSESAYEYIRSGYKSPYEDRQMEYLNCRKPLSELMQNDMILMRYTFSFKEYLLDEEYYAWGGYNESGLREDRYTNLTLSFLKRPDNPGTYKLMFSFTKADGTVLTCSTLVNFD